MLHQILLYSDQIKEADMGEVCSMYRIDKKCTQNFSQKTRREGTTQKT